MLVYTVYIVNSTILLKSSKLKICKAKSDYYAVLLRNISLLLLDYICFEDCSRI